MSVTASLDMGVYSPGDTMTLSVVRDTPPVQIDVPVVAADGTVLATASAQLVERFSIGDPNRTWTAVSDDGTTAVFTSVA